MTYRNQLRIIGGEWKRRLLKFPDGDGLRPTPDRVRETLFNWLGQDLTGLHCLDLFAGSGALGFEAASRGASQVVLVESASTAQQQLKANIELLQAAPRVHLRTDDALAFLRRSQLEFDLIFVDPPFASDLLQRCLPGLLPRLRPAGLVYVESAQPLDALPGWAVLKSGRAGQVHYGLLQPQRLPDATAAAPERPAA